MAEKNNTQMPDVNEQIKVTVWISLKTLQEEGRDPFEITKYDVTNHTYQDIKATVLKILKARNVIHCRTY